MKIIVMILFFPLMILSCGKKTPIYKFSEDNKSLTISQYRIKNENLKLDTIILLDKEGNVQQKIILNDSNFLLSKIENYIGLPNGKRYLNSISNFDDEGSIDFSTSYFAENRIEMINNEPYLICYFPFSYNNDKKYILNQNYKDNDTTFFDTNNIAKVKIKDFELGKNNIKYVIHDETIKKDTVFRTKLFIDKTFFIAK